MKITQKKDKNKVTIWLGYGMNLYKRLRKQCSHYWISPLSLNTDLTGIFNVKLKPFWIKINFFFQERFFYNDFMIYDVTKSLDKMKAYKNFQGIF